VHTSTMLLRPLAYHVPLACKPLENEDPLMTQCVASSTPPLTGRWCH